MLAKERYLYELQGKPILAGRATHGFDYTVAQTAFLRQPLPILKFDLRKIKIRQVSWLPLQDCTYQYHIVAKTKMER